jgi:formylglycine-generating enzyme required for sulfatase activity
MREILTTYPWVTERLKRNHWPDVREYPPLPTLQTLEQFLQTSAPPNAASWQQIVQGGSLPDVHKLVIELGTLFTYLPEAIFSFYQHAAPHEGALATEQACMAWFSHGRSSLQSFLSAAFLNHPEKPPGTSASMQDIPPYPETKTHTDSLCPLPPNPPDAARALIDAGHYQQALALLEPWAHAGNLEAQLFLAELVETVAAPRDLRLAAATLLGDTGDPRLLDPTTGNNQFAQQGKMSVSHPLAQYRLQQYWCVIEAGPFWFGDDHTEKLRQRTLPYRYAIARYLVTNAEYLHFIQDRGYKEQRWWTAQGVAYQQRCSATRPYKWKVKPFHRPNQPVIGTSWYEAMAYCIWLTEQGHTQGWLAPYEHIRLPTSLEWERAARHTDRRRYPWGNEAVTPEHAHLQDTYIKIGEPSPVGCFPRGAAACGAMDMLGNVSWEWTATPAEQETEMVPQSDFALDDEVWLRGDEWHEEAAQDYRIMRCKVCVDLGVDLIGIRLIRSLIHPFDRDA